MDELLKFLLEFLSIITGDLFKSKEQREKEKQEMYGKFNEILADRQVNPQKHKLFVFVALLSIIAFIIGGIYIKLKTTLPDSIEIFWCLYILSAIIFVCILPKIFKI